MQVVLCLVYLLFFRQLTFAFYGITRWLLNGVYILAQIKILCWKSQEVKKSI